MLRLAEKAFRPGRFPFPLVHIDTGHNFDEVIAFRDARAAELGEPLVVRSVEDSIKRGSVVLRRETDSRNAAQAVTLLETIEEHGFDACIGGARRDEEKARAKERIFSFRDELRPVGPQGPAPGTVEPVQHPGAPRRAHARVPDLQLDRAGRLAVHRPRERLALPSIYFGHEREVVRRKGLLVPVTRPDAAAGRRDRRDRLSVRFRTVGDMTCTCPVEPRMPPTPPTSSPRQR